METETKKTEKWSTKIHWDPLWNIIYTMIFTIFPTCIQIRMSIQLEACFSDSLMFFHSKMTLQSTTRHEHAIFPYLLLVPESALDRDNEE